MTAKTSAQVIDFLPYLRKGLPPLPEKRYGYPQRRHWKWTLGFSDVEIDTFLAVLTIEEFNARMAEREADLLPPERLSGKKEAGESDWHASIRISAEPKKTRRRAFGVTAARRAYADAFGCSIKTALKHTAGMDAAQVMSVVETRLAPARAAQTDLFADGDESAPQRPSGARA
ncbi:hypothetical protein [Methylorubrum thiocyanatum]|uniref:Uncharacterized protein n=1 Tax=Methylorubrum thiocyanatum TaxID=47958 RepID=A0AA40S7R9_9HYPH|nr:hypothetical protein [Methylorubrum thiocyanatum]MBA8916010.1 hypothetical protein [Methylorubrum thiocyanatum]GJE80906.1 hypothetical protein CJNNKLLH_2247 [Methylorubrum thiocyanatum]